MRALAKEPADRFPDCSSFVRTLGEANEPAAAGIMARPAPAPAQPASALLRPSPDAQSPRSRRWLQRRWVVGAAALALLIALGGVVYLAAPRTPIDTTHPPDGLGHGSLIYDAKLTSAAWSSGGAPAPNPANSVSVQYSASSIDLKILKDGAGFSGEFDGPALKEYVSHLVFRVDAGSDFEINWHVRGSGPSEAAEIGLNIEVAQEVMTLYLSPTVGSNQALAATIPAPGLQGGRTVDLGIVVKGTSVSMFLDNVRVAQVIETRSTGAAVPSFYMDGKSGALHILALRYYALP
jgi:hypothetical protein